MRFLLTENYLCHTFLSVNDEDEHASAGSASSAARAALSRPRQRAEPQRTPAGSSGGGTPHHSAEPALPQPACLGSGGGGSLVRHLVDVICLPVEDPMENGLGQRPARLRV
eukprot:COSAG02_NODE_31755_length_528_cov_0.568765_1_plen_110_part_10